MAFQAVTKIEGLQPLLDKLDALGSKQAKKTAVLRKATAKGAKIVLDAAKANLRAMGFKRKDSLLLQSLGSKVVVGKSGVYAVVGPRTGFKRTRQGKVVTKLGAKFESVGVNPVRYAHLVEKGRRGIVPVGKRRLRFLLPDGTIAWGMSARPVQARPFLTPALERNREKVAAVMGAEIAAGITKLAKSG